MLYGTIGEPGEPEVLVPGGNTDVRSPTHTEVRSPTRTEVRSPTRTATEVRSPTSTSTEAYTQGNMTVTVTGGAGEGDTYVGIHAPPLNRENTASSRGPGTSAQDNVNVNAPRPDESDGYLASVAPSSSGWMTLATFVAGAGAGYVAARRHPEPERLLVAAVVGLIAVPVIMAATRPRELGDDPDVTDSA